MRGTGGLGGQSQRLCLICRPAQAFADRGWHVLESLLAGPGWECVCVNSVCNVPVFFRMCLPPLGTQNGVGGKVGEREGWRNVGRHSDGPRLPRPPEAQEAQGKATPLGKYQVPRLAPAVKLASLVRMPHLPTCPPARLQLRDPVPRCWSRFRAFAFGSGGMAPHMWSSSAPLWTQDLQVLGLADAGTLTSPETL